MQTGPYIQLLGAPRVTLGSEILSLSTKQVALLSLFPIKRVRRIDRGEVSRILWPQSSLASGRHSLSQCLYRLGVISKGRFPVTGTSTAIELGEVHIDLNQFVAAVRRCDWHEAESLLRGDLLEGISIPDADEYNALLAKARARYRRLAEDVAEELILGGHHELSAGLLNRLPHSLHQSRTGASVSELLSQNARLETKGRALTGVDQSSLLTKFNIPFVGRRDELKLLEQYSEQSIRDGIVTILVEGEAGIGKTSLVERFTRRRALRGSRTISARGYGAESQLPFGIVAQWLRDLPPNSISADSPWIHVIDRYFPGIFGTGNAPSAYDHEASDAYQVLEALTQLFGTLSESYPLIVVTDDAQFTDPASVGFAHYVSRRSPASRILFVNIVTTPVVTSGNPFRDWDNLVRLTVKPFSPSEAAMLIEKMVGTTSVTANSFLTEVPRKAGGNPLLIMLLLAAAEATETTTVPDSIIDFFTPHFDKLSADALGFLAAMSILGNAANPGIAAKIAGLSVSPDAVSPELSELVEMSLVLTERDGTILPRHGIVTEAALRRLPEVEQRAMFGRAARVLEDRGLSSPAVSAVHHDIAGERLQAFRAAITAASASKDLYAVREQEFFLKLALSNAPDIESAAQVRISLAELYRSDGRFKEGLQMVAEDLLQSAPSNVQARATATRLAIRLASVKDIEGTAQALYQIEELSEHLDKETTAELYLALAAAAHDLGYVSDTLLAAQRTHEITELLAPTTRATRLASNCAFLVGVYHDVDVGLAKTAQLVAAPGLTSEARSHCLTAHGSLLVLAGRLLEAEPALLEAVQLAERHWLQNTLTSLHNNLGLCYLEQGRYEEATRAFEKASNGPGPNDSVIATDNLATTFLECGDFKLAIQTLTRTSHPALLRSSRRLFLYHAIIGLASLELGLLAKAFEAKREIELLFQSHEYWSNDTSYIEAFLARMLTMEGNEAGARARLEKAIEIYEHRDVMCRSRLELALAGLDLRTDPSASLRRCERMLEQLRGSGARPLIERFEDLADRARLRGS
jgi:tetratricopeptide (TPR) repeat protein